MPSFLCELTVERIIDRALLRMRMRKRSGGGGDGGGGGGGDPGPENDSTNAGDFSQFDESVFKVNS